MDVGRTAPKRIRVTQGSCWPCRDRRVKCDTRKPRCGRCSAEENDDCSYSKMRLRWDNQIVSRGRWRGQRSSASPLGAPLSRRDAGGSWHLMYFAAEILPRFSLSDTPTAADLESLSQDPALANTVHAVTHAHLLFRNLSSSADTVRENIQARTNAIQTFREQLRRSSYQSPSIFQASVLLCMLDGMLEPQMDGAATKIHYQGGKAIVHQLSNLEVITKDKQGLTALLLTVFSTMDLTHAVLSGCSPIFGPEFWRSLRGFDAWWTGLESDSAFLELMALLAQTARLGYDACCTGELPPMRVVLSLQLSLERTKTIPRQVDGSNASPTAAFETGSIDGGSSSEGEEMAFCAAYRSAAGIYMYRALCGLHITDDLVQQCVEEGMRAICHTSFAGKHPHCLLFPILIVGSHCLEAEGRNEILQTLDPSLNYLGFGSVKELREFLITTWQQQCVSNWWIQFQSIASKAFVF